MELPPLSLYVHIPWCVRKCPYCDFNSHETKSTLPEAEYLAALCADFESELAAIAGREIESIFIGGGTPSLFSATTYAELLAFVQRHTPLARTCEITLEANPGTAEAAKFRAYRDIGINRLSLGIQSFDDRQLRTLGRIHDAAQAKAAIAMARTSGFDNFNLDLMHGLPDQTPDDAANDLRQALEFQPAHLSWYQLTIEPNTVFHSRPPVLPPEPGLLAIQEQGQQLLAGHGYEQYEVSAYARAQQASRHNLNYWRFGDYIGIGAGAHGKLSDAASGTIVRTRKLKQPMHYLANSLDRTAERKAVAQEDLSLEFLLNALRLRQGFTTAQFESRTGLPFSTIGNRVEYLVSQSLLEREADWIRPTPRGYEMLNSLLEEFL